MLFLFALLEGLRRKGYICAGKHDEGLDDAVWDPANYSPSAATIGRASNPEKEELDEGAMMGVGGGTGERPRSQAWSVTSSSNYGAGQQDMRSLSPQNGNYGDRRSMNQGMAAAYLGANMLSNRHSQGSYDGYLPPSPPHQQQDMQQQQQSYYRQNPIADPSALYRSPSDSHTPPDGRTPSDPFLTPTLSDGGHSGQTHATTGSSLNGHQQQYSQPPPLPSPTRPSANPLAPNERPISRSDSVRSVVDPPQTFGTLRIMNITEEED